MPFHLVIIFKYIITPQQLVYTSDVNDAEPRLSFSEKHRARTETLAKRARA